MEKQIPISNTEMVAKILATRVAGKITLPAQTGKLERFACANVTVVATSKDLLPHAPNEFGQPKWVRTGKAKMISGTVHVFDQRAAQQRVLPVGGWTGQVRVHVYRRLAHHGRLGPMAVPLGKTRTVNLVVSEGDVQDARVITVSAGRSHRPTRRPVGPEFGLHRSD